MSKLFGDWRILFISMRRARCVLKFEKTFFLRYISKGNRSISVEYGQQLWAGLPVKGGGWPGLYVTAVSAGSGILQFICKMITGVSKGSLEAFQTDPPARKFPGPRDKRVVISKMSKSSKKHQKASKNHFFRHFGSGEPVGELRAWHEKLELTLLC